MDNDSIRSSGSGNTLVEIWIDGKLRGITISRGAIEGFLNLSPNQAQAMSAEDRCEFVRSNLTLVMNAVRARLQETGDDSTVVSIEDGQLGGSVTASRSSSDRRRSERRKGGDRRKPEPPGPRKEGDRRVSDRRKSNRRRPAPRS